MSDRTVLLIGTLDTKGDEYAYVRDRIRARGHQVLVVDIGILRDPSFVPDIPAAEVASAGGTELTALRARGDRSSAVDVMQRGACALVPALFAAHRFDGVLGLGGGGGTAMITAAMSPGSTMIADTPRSRSSAASVRVSSSSAALLAPYGPHPA